MTKLPLDAKRFRSAAAQKRVKARFEVVRCIGWLGVRDANTRQSLLPARGAVCNLVEVLKQGRQFELVHSCRTANAH